MTMCAKFFPCDEFDWLTEFVEYQTSEHQAKIKFTQGAQGSCEGRKTSCLHRRSLFFVPARKLLRQPRSQGSLLPVPYGARERRRVGERTWERGCSSAFFPSPQPPYDIKRSVRRVMGSWPLC